MLATMADVERLLPRVELALAQAKLVRREAAKNVVQLARLRDTLQPDTPAQGEEELHAFQAQERG